MLEVLRNSVNTWTAKILLGLLVISFAAWGVADVFTGRTHSVVATVGESEISTQEYARQLSERLQQHQVRTGEVLSVSAAREQGLDRQVLAQLGTRAALAEEARLLGVSASDADIGRALSDIDAFKAAGSFERELYDQWLSSRQRSASGFEADVRRDLVRQTLLEAVATGVSAPRELSEALYTYQSERRSLEYILLTPDSADDPGEPTEEQIIAFHEGSAERFTAPEYRALSIVWLTSEALAEGIEISEEEIAKAYQERREGGEYTTPETRTLGQILFNNEEEAKAAYERVKGDETFATIAEERELSASSISLGTVERSDLPTDAASAAFAATEEGVLAPVKTAFGWSMLDVLEVGRAKTSTLEEVRDEIRTDLAQIISRDRIVEEMVAVDDELAGGSTPSQAATATEARYVKIDQTDLQGLTRSGERAEGLPPIADILPAAFEAGIGEDAVLTEVDGGGFFAVTVDSFVDSQLRKLDEVRDDVVASWKLEQRTDQLEGIAKGLRTQMEGGASLADIAEAKDMEVATAGPILRSQRPQHLTETLRDALFSGEPGDVLDGRADGDAGYVIGVLKEAETIEDESQTEAVDRVTEQYAVQISNDLMEGYTRSAVARHPLLANSQAVDNVLAELGQYY